MSNYVVIAQSPSVDVSTVVGPLRTYTKALLTSDALRDRGYMTEIARLERLSDVENSPPWFND